MWVNKEAANKDVEQPSVGTLELVPLDEGDHGRDTHNTQSHEEGTGEPSIAPARKTSHWKFVGKLKPPMVSSFTSTSTSNQFVLMFVKLHRIHRIDHDGSWSLHWYHQ